ncbi:MAG: DUF6530 family protein [Anaerolineales bacterium]|nr:DUF6530 family protein [Anaerolineales bacterium]
MLAYSTQSSTSFANERSRRERGKVEIVAKVWRHTGEKWSRQSEEMPLHRVLDLAILIIKTRLFFRERYHKNEKDYVNYPLLDRVGLQGGAMNVAICIANEMIGSDLNLFDDCLREDDEILSERLNQVYGLLKELIEE